MAKVTLQSIADRVGVSRMTVSNAFSRPDQLSAALRERILTEAEALGYTGPDPSARSLARGTTGTIGVLWSGRLRHTLSDEVSAGFLGAIADELAPPSPSEVTEAVADFDGDAPADTAPVQDSANDSANDGENHRPAPAPVEASQPSETIAPASEPVAPESAADAEKSVRRRSTVREKFSFASSDAPAAPVATEAAQAAPVDGLDQEVQRSLPQGVDRGLHRGVAGDHDEVRPVAGQLVDAQQLQAVAVGKP